MILAIDVGNTNIVVGAIDHDRKTLFIERLSTVKTKTETEYATTVDFLTRVGLYETHIFKYSRRQGTKAAVMPDQIPEPVKGVRSDRLIALGEENRKRFEQSWIGKRAEVLFEEQTVIDGKTYFVGYTKEYIRVAIPADQDYANRELTGILKPGPAEHVLLL